MKQEKQQQHKNYTLNRKLKTISSLCDVCVCVCGYVCTCEDKNDDDDTTTEKSSHLYLLRRCHFKHDYCTFICIFRIYK